MVLVTVKWHPKKESVANFLKIFKSLAPIVKKESGCLEYKLHRDLEKDEYFLFEQWESKQHLDAHLATAHMKNFFDQTSDLFLKPPVIKIFNTTK